jgi:hypothetical protein
MFPGVPGNSAIYSLVKFLLIEDIPHCDFISPGDCLQFLTFDLVVEKNVLKTGEVFFCSGCYILLLQVAICIFLSTVI